MVLLAAVLLACAALITPGFILDALGNAHLSDIRISTVLGGSKIDGSFDAGVIVDTLTQLRLLAAALGGVCAFLGFAMLRRPTLVTVIRARLAIIFARLDNKTADHLYCTGMAIIILVVTLVATRNGAGLDPDSVVYVATGRDLYLGRGFGDFVAWPPGYPLLIAGGMHLGLAAEQAARLVPALSISLSTFPLFIMGRLLGGRTAGYLSSLIPLVLWPLALVSVYAWSEMPYIFFSLCSVLCLTCLAASDGSRGRLYLLFVAAVFAACVALMRYIGVSVIVTGALVILLDRRFSLKQRLLEAIGFGIVAAGPTGAWVVRNMLNTGTPAGPRPDSPTGPGYNLWSTVSQMVSDLVSGDILRTLWPAGAYMATAAFGMLFVMLLLLATNRHDRTTIGRYVRRAFPMMLYVSVYLASLAVVASVWSFIPLYVRFVAPTYPFLASLLIAFGCRLSSALLANTDRRAFLGTFVTLLLLLVALQTPSTLIVRNGAEQGYSYNSPFWRQAESVSWAQRELEPGTTVYTNHGYALKLRLPEVELQWMPSDEASPSEHERFYQGLAASPSACAIIYKNHVAPFAFQYANEELRRLNGEQNLLVIVADFPEATVWRAEDL